MTEVKDLLLMHMPVLKLLASELIANETLNSGQIDSILGAAPAPVPELATIAFRNEI